MRLPSEIRARVLEFLVCFDNTLYQIDNSHNYSLFSWREEGSEGVETTKVPWGDQAEKHQRNGETNQQSQNSVHLDILAVSMQV